MIVNEPIQSSYYIHTLATRECNITHTHEHELASMRNKSTIFNYLIFDLYFNKYISIYILIVQYT